MNEKEVWESINTDPFSKNWSQEQKQKMFDQIMEEGNPIVQATVDKTVFDLQAQFEIILYLLNKTDVSGLYISLLYLKQIGYLQIKDQNDIIKLLNLSRQTYFTKRDKLMKLGLIAIVRQHKRQIITFKGFRRIPHFVLPTDVTAFDSYIIDAANSIRPISSTILKTQKAINVEKAKQLEIEQKTNEKVQAELKRREQKKKEEDVSFDGENYKLVIHAYEQNKGVRLSGAYVLRAKKSIKEMFKAGYKVKQIVDCIKWFAEAEKIEEIKWVQQNSWTIETVMKKMPEFVAGKLTIKKLGDDLPEYT